MADARRFAAMHLRARLGPDGHAEAAAGGLQDSAPRAGLLALHARMAGVEPGSWEHPALAQVWFRWADHLVPADDVGLFTRGAMPRDAAAAAALEATADAVVRRLAGEARPSREVMDEGSAGTAVRAAAVTGRYRIRWDASSIVVVPQDRPDVDDEETRIGLARRFLQWHAPATDRDFARWAGVTRADAEATWRALGPETETSSAPPPPAESPRGVRLLPPGDPWRFLAVDPPRTTEPPDVPARVRNALQGRVLLDGAVAGAWARADADVTLDPWVPLGAGERDRVDEEVDRLATPLGRPVRVRWLDRPDDGWSARSRRRG